MPQGRALRVLAGGLLVVALVIVFMSRIQRKMRDFEVYWTAGERAIAAEPLYRESDQHYRFKYLPVFALIAIPFALLPLAVAKAVWFALSVCALILLLYVSSREVPEPVLPRAWLVGVTFVAMAKFYAHELVLGQINILFALMIVGALVALLRRRDTVAGAWSGAAIVVKPYAFLLIPYLFLVRRFRAAATAGLATAVALIAPVVRYGVAGTLQLYRDWWRTVTETTVATLTGADAVSIAALAAKWLGWGSTAQIVAIGGIAMLAVAFLAVLACRSRVGAPEYLEIALLLTLIPLVTPQGWAYMLLLSTPLVMALVGIAPRLGIVDRTIFFVALAIVGFSIHDVMGRAAYLTFMSWSAITVCYLVIVAVAVRVRLRGLA
jgi:hypothetical protein